jgi:uroporphyrinogen-III synthase
MPKLPPLSTWTIVSLRPQGQHAAIRYAVNRRNARFCALSVTKLVAQENHSDLEKALASDVRIMSSPSAVRYAQPFANLAGNWLAVGQSTAKQLFAAGASSVQVPALQTADGLLALHVMQNIAGRSVGLITAPNGRGLLEKTLQERGAHLNIAHVYRRQSIALSSKQLSAIDSFSAQTAILVTSGGAFEVLWQQLSKHRQAIIKASLCVASSARLVDYLHSLGIRRVLCSNSTLPRDQIRTLAQAVFSYESSGAMDERHTTHDNRNEK